MLLLIADKCNILQLMNKYKINEWNCQCEYSTNITLNETAQYKWIRQTVITMMSDDETVSNKHGNLQ